MQNCINALSDKTIEIVKIQLRYFLNDVLSKLTKQRVLKKHLGLQNYKPTHLHTKDNNTSIVRNFIEYVNQTLDDMFEEVKNKISLKPNSEEIIDLRTKYCVRKISGKDYVKMARKITFIDIANNRHYDKKSNIVLCKKTEIAVGKYNLETKITENLSFEDVIYSINMGWSYDENRVIKGAASIEIDVTL